MREEETKTTVIQNNDTTSVESPKSYETKKAIFRANQVLWYIVGFIEVILTFRIVLKALGANPASGFTSFVYAISDPFALPFAGIFGISASRGNVVEWSTFVAMAVYLVLGYGIAKLLLLGKPTDQQEVHQEVDNR